MKSTENFLSVLDAAIHNKPVTNLEKETCLELLRMSQAHNVLPLVFEKLCELPQFADLLEFETYKKRVMKIIAMQIQRTYAFLELYQAFSDAGLHPLVMKGIICRQLYGERCDYRPSGDEDILIQTKDYEKVMAVLTVKGFLPAWEDVTENQLEELQEISFHQPNCGLTVEVHMNPIGRENNIRCRMDDCFQTVFEHPKEVVIEGISIWTMNETDHLLFLVLHAFKHMMVTGFGIRQVMDILLFYEQNEKTINISYILDMLDKVKAKKFLSDLIYLGNRYLGFHFPLFEESYCVEELLDDLMGNGVFGNATPVQHMAKAMTNAVVERGRRRGGANLIQAVFPSRKYLMPGYPELVEKPWLLPVCWAKRWKKFFGHSMQNRGQLAVESVEISNRKIELLRKYDVL